MAAFDELREAARLMRERAEAVYPERPWNELIVGRSGTALLHAESWTPAVALAVADWLDYAAQTWLPDLAPGAVWGDQEQALAVARTYLGGVR